MDTLQAVEPRFTPLDRQNGVRIFDPIEDAQFTLYTPSSPSLAPTTTDVFYFPVDAAVEFETARLRTPHRLDIWIRDAEGNLVAEAGTQSASVAPGTYNIEFGSTAMKVYLAVESAVEVIPGDHMLDLAFDGETTVRIGTRSFHEHPAQTITTTDDPTDLMQAISCFGSALKTYSPERSFPTLRGHPPLLERGNELVIPDGLTPPTSDVRLTIPAKHDWLYPVTSTAYYLAATVEASAPALHLAGERYPLGSEGDYERDGGSPVSERELVERHLSDILQHTFLLDCVARTDGYYKVDLESRRKVEATGVDLPFGELYNVPLAERLQAYLSVPFEQLTDVRPDWGLVADVQPNSENLTILPFLAENLAVIRCPEPEITEPATRSQLVDEFLRGGHATTPTLRGPAEPMALTPESATPLWRASSETSSGATVSASQPIISAPSADNAIAQAWVGDGFPIGVAKASVESYLRQLELHSEEKTRISVDVVVNDAEMRLERNVSSIYGTRDLLEFDVAIHENLSRDALADLFESETDFIHYAGHVEEGGLQCSDGFLDADEIGRVETNAFFLNACSSYAQGNRFVEKGAIAGVVTVMDVLNTPATKIGRHVARLINHGFSLQKALDIVANALYSANQYIVVGDGNAELVQSDSGSPYIAFLESCENGGFAINIEAYPSKTFGIGSLITPYIAGNSRRFLNSGRLDQFLVNTAELEDFLSLGPFPLIVNYSLVWSDEVSAVEIRDALRSGNRLSR